MSSELRIKTDYIRAWHKRALKTGSDADHAILEIAENFDAIRSALTGPAGTGGGGGEKERAFWDEVRRRDNEVVKHLTELGAANAAFHAGWVSRADHRALKSRLAAAQQDAKDAMSMICQAQREKAAAEKRAEEAEKGALYKAGLGSGICPLCLAAFAGDRIRESLVEHLLTDCKIVGNACMAERDSLKAELDKAKARLDELDRFDVLGMTGRLNTALSERDSALARVKELDEVMKNIVLSLSHVKPTIREAAGAQP